MGGLKIKIAVLAQAFVVMGILIASTVFGEIAGTFPDASLTAVQLIMSLAMIASLVFTLVAGFLGNMLDKKMLSVIAMVFLLIGGLLPVFMHGSITHLYISSLLIGVGQGILMTNIASICSILFEGETQSKMFGWQTAMQNGGSVVLMLIAGYLARTGWSNAYWSFLVVIVAIVVTLMWLPKIPPTAQTDQVTEKTGLILPPANVFVISVLLAFYFAAYSTFFLNIPIYITVEGLGDPRLISVVMSVSTIMGFIGGIIFAYVLKVTGRFTIAMSALITAIGYIILVAAPNMVTVFVAAVCSGTAFAWAISGGIQVVSDTVIPEQLSNSMGVYMAFTSLGAALSPVIINALATLVPIEGTLAAFITSSVILIILTIVFIIWAVAGKSSSPNTARVVK